MPVLLLYSPFPTIESARLASHALLQARLVACCNLLSGTESHYQWDGLLIQSAETILIAKTTPEIAESARDMIAANHPHKVPAILSFRADATPSFALWVQSSIEPIKKSNKGD